MKTLTFILLASCMVLNHYVKAQSFYTFEYRFQHGKDSNLYHAFLQRNSDGSGLLRIRYTGSKPDEDNLVEAFIDEQNPVGKNEEPDTSLLLISAVNPVFIQKSGNASLTVPAFIFRYQASNTVFEPVGVTAAENPAVKNNNGFKWQFLSEIQLTRDVVSNYFSEDDAFYSNLFNTQSTKGLTPAEKNIKMHLLIVADTMDASIGIAVAIDIKRVTELFSSICNYLGIKLDTTILTGKSFGKASTSSALAKLRPAANDIVIFYYSGHGFRIPEKPRAFPNMKLKNVKTPRASFSDSLAWAKASRTANIGQSLNIADVFQTIYKKGARMNLVISDCCNDDIFSVNFKSTKPSGTKSVSIKWSEQNLRTLFLNTTPISILSTACTETQTSASQDDFGSFYTYYLKSSLESYSSILKNNVSWDQVLKQAQGQTTLKASNTYCSKPRIPENLCKQNPVYRIFIGKNQKITL